MRWLLRSGTNSLLARTLAPGGAVNLDPIFQMSRAGTSIAMLGTPPTDTGTYLEVERNVGGGYSLNFPMPRGGYVASYVRVNVAQADYENDWYPYIVTLRSADGGIGTGSPPNVAFRMVNGLTAIRTHNELGPAPDYEVRDVIDQTGRTPIPLGEWAVVEYYFFGQEMATRSPYDADWVTRATYEPWAETTQLIIGADNRTFIDDNPSWGGITPFDIGGIVIYDQMPTEAQRAYAVAWVTGSVTRDFVADDEAIGASGHSLLDAMTGATDPTEGILHALRSGTINQTFLGWSSLAQRWAENGPERTASYSGTLIVTEIADLLTGVADPASAQGQETLQYLYWYALTAQNKGCPFFTIYTIWPPSTVDAPTRAAVTADILAKAQYWRQWLEARPEITIPVYVIPTAPYINAAVALYDPVSVHRDDIHLQTSTQVEEGLGWYGWMFLRGQKAPEDGGRDATLQALIDSGWDLLTGPGGYEMAGLGGEIVVTAYPVASDPLPNPSPLPGG